MVYFIKNKLVKPHLNQENGAAAVEFAAALIGLLLFFAIFVQFVGFFITHQRLIFTGFVASRTYAVRGMGKAVSAANSVDSKAYPVKLKRTGAYTRKIEISKRVSIPRAFRKIFSNGSSQYTIKVTTPSFDEVMLKRRLKGDNRE